MLVDICNVLSKQNVQDQFYQIILTFIVIGSSHYCAFVIRSWFVHKKYCLVTLTNTRFCHFLQVTCTSLHVQIFREVFHELPVRTKSNITDLQLKNSCPIFDQSPIFVSTLIRNINSCTGYTHQSPY